MLAENVETAPMTQADHRASFFRQSGWLMIANIAGGVLMYAVHFLALFLEVSWKRKIPLRYTAGSA